MIIHSIVEEIIMNFKSKLYSILEDINRIENSSNDLLDKSIQERLIITLNNYQESIDYSKKVLSEKNPLMIMRKLNRRMKND